MWKCVFHMSSHIIVYLLCLHIHLGVSASTRLRDLSESAEGKKSLRRNPALSWERDRDYGPAISAENEMRFIKETYSWEKKPEYGPANTIADNKAPANTLADKKSKNRNASFKSATRNNVPNKDKQRPRAEIEFFNEDSQEPQNRKPYFRIQQDHNKVMQMPPDKFEVKETNINVSQIVPQQKKVPDVAHAHSRESYLHSEANLALKSRLNKPHSQSQVKTQGLSIEAGGIRDVVTYRPRKGFDRIPNQQLPQKMENYKEITEGVKSKIKYENPNNVKHDDNDDNNNTKYNNDKLNDEKYKNQNYKHNSDIEHESQKSLPRAKEEFGKQYKNSKSRIHSNFYSVEQPDDKTFKQSGKSKKDWDDITKIEKQVKYHIVPKRQHLRPDRGRNRYDQSSGLQSEEDYEFHGKKSERNQEKRGSYSKKEQHRERYGHSRERHDQSWKESYKTQKGSKYSREETKYKNLKKINNMVSDEHEVHRQYKKLDTGDMRVTEVFNKFHDELDHTETARNKHKSLSYESIQINSGEDNSDIQDDDITGKAGAVRMHPTVHPKLHDDMQPGSNGKPLSAAELLETEVFKPYSIGKQLNFLRNKLNDFAIIDQEVIGRTVEYNEIVLWKMKEKPEESARYNFRASNKKKYAEEPPEKKIIFIVHGLTVMGWHRLDCLSKIKRFETLVGYYIENLDCYDIYLIPMANPDGVAKALVTQPWNKNVSPQNACPGVNLDRNFDVGWNGTYTEGRGSSCRQTYPGPIPFSEHETRAIRDIFHKFGHKIVAYLHVHAGSYDSGVFKGDAVLYPKGYTERQVDDDKYIDLKGDVEEAMRNTSFKVISVNVDTLYNWYGTTKGTSVDYASSVYGIPYAMELVMQVYQDDPMVSDEDKREKNSALTEIWQVIIDVMLDGIYKHAVKPSEI